MNADTDAVSQMLATHKQNLERLGQEGARFMAEVTLALCPDATELVLSWDLEQLYVGDAIRADGTRANLDELGLSTDDSIKLDEACSAVFTGLDYVEPWFRNFDDVTGHGVLRLELCQPEE